MPNECRVPYCHREPWGDLLRCKKHTLFSRQHMQKQRAKKRALELVVLEDRIGTLLWLHRRVDPWIAAKFVMAKIAAHINRTRRRRAG